MASVNYEIVEEEGMLIFAMYKQDEEPVDPAFYYYPFQNKICLERGPMKKVVIDLNEGVGEVFQRHKEIMVTETNFFDPDDFVTYFLPIETISDPNIEFPDKK